MQENELLIRRAQKRDAKAFEALMVPHEKKIYALCLRMLSNREDALDCAQDAMLRIWRSIGSYRQQASFATWSYRIATNACLDMLRKRKTRPSVSLDMMTEDGFAPQAGDAHDPQAQAEGSARRQAIVDGMKSLPDDLRAALVLRDVQGLSYEEVASIQGVALGTVKSRINRAREKLRGFLGGAELFRTPAVYTGERREDA